MNESNQEKKAHTAGESVVPSDDGSRDEGDATGGTTVTPQTIIGPGKGDDGDDEH